MNCKKVKKIKKSKTAKNIEFSYKHARIHRKGKGFLGFEEVTAKNNATGINTINIYGYDNQYFNVFLKKTEKKLSSGTVLSLTDYTTETPSLGNKRISPYIKNTVFDDKLTGNIITNNVLWYDYDHGNIYSQETIYGGNSDFKITRITEYKSYANWGIRNKLDWQITTTEHKDDENAEYLRYTDFIYDEKGNLLQEIMDGGFITTTFSEYKYGLPEKIVTKESKLTQTKTFTYDSRYRFIETTSIEGLGITQQKYSPEGNLQYDIDITGLKTSCKYDGFGRNTGIKTPEGHIITTTYSWEKNNTLKSISKIITTAPGRPTVTAYYDILGREVRTKTTGFSGTKITDTEFNAKGELYRTSLPYFEGGGTRYWTTNEYYSDGRIQKVTVGLPTSLVTSYTYSGNKVTVIFIIIIPRTK